MSKKNRDPMSITRGKDLVKEAQDNGAYIDRIKGDHYIMKGPQPGICPIPYRDNNMSVGLRKSIISQLAKIGVVLGVLVVIVSIYFIG
jgi:predicted RNA binding protein YcfA (HicA-like mRNA interferase family)